MADPVLTPEQIAQEAALMKQLQSKGRAAAPSKPPMEVSPQAPAKSGAILDALKRRMGAEGL